MKFSIRTYTIAETESYLSLAKKLVAEDERFSEFENSEMFIKEVSFGIQKQLDNKSLVAGQSVKLVDNIEFYLNSVSTATAGLIQKKNSANTTTVNQIRKVNTPLLFNIREFKDYKDYLWLEYAYGYEEKHGEIGTGANGINGDKTNAEVVKQGYIYVFENNKDLRHTFGFKCRAVMLLSETYYFLSHCFLW